MTISVVRHEDLEFVADMRRLQVVNFRVGQCGLGVVDGHGVLAVGLEIGAQRHAKGARLEDSQPGRRQRVGCGAEADDGAVQHRDAALVEDISAESSARGQNQTVLRFGAEIRRLLSMVSRPIGVETSSGVFEADRYVPALGTNAPDLLRSLGIRIPVYQLKGYSLPLPLICERAAPRISVTDFERKVVYALLGNQPV